MNTDLPVCLLNKLVKLGFLWGGVFVVNRSAVALWFLNCHSGGMLPGLNCIDLQNELSKLFIGSMSTMTQIAVADTQV